MNFAMVVTTPDSKFAGVALRGSMADSLARVKRLGFQGVELSYRDPKTVDVPALRGLLDSHGLPVVGLATGRSYGEDRLSFTDRDAAVRRKANARVIDYLELARVLDNPLLIFGLMRGFIPQNVKPTTARGWARDAVRRAADRAARHGTRIVVEPLNRFECNFLQTVDETLEFLDEVGRPNVGILADSFHMNIEDVSITGSLRRAGKRLFHVHVADSNRWAPGTGHLDFTDIFRTLRAMRYTGYVSVECMPKPDPESCPRIAMATLRKADAASRRAR